MTEKTQEKIGLIAEGSLTNSELFNKSYGKYFLH